MAETCHRRSACRLCAGIDLQEVLSLEPTPPANAFVPKELVGKDQAVFPLDIFFCQSCGHVQLLDVVDPKILFENYVYVSGTSPVFVKHFEDYANDVLNTYQPPKGAMVVDIGSNDGTLLSFFKKAGQTVLGIDPAKGISQDATERGIETWCDFFTPELSAKINQEHAPAHVITANNVFAHADDLTSIARGIADLLAPGGVFVFEVSYLVDVFKDVLFDTIYHEHMAYHAVGPLQRFFPQVGLELFAAERVPSHGGSLRGFVQLAGGTHTGDGSVDRLLEIERRLKLDDSTTLKEFGARIDRLGETFTGVLRELVAAGNTIAAYGAPAKCTTLLHHFGIAPGVIEFIVDDSPLKQGLYSPGLHIPVVASDVLLERMPDVLIILAWNFADVIMEKNAEFRDKGGKFLIPVPKVRLCP